MCEFLSWAEYKGRLYYLTNFELNTRQGKELKKELNYSFYEEITGHGAIKEYFGLPHAQCKDHECTDFSSPDNFPAEIVAKIKAGEFSQIGIAKEMLTESALAEHKKINKSAWVEYERIQQSAKNKRNITLRSAYAEYEKLEQPTQAKHEKTWQTRLVECEKIRQSVEIKYEGIEQPAWAKYKKIQQSIFWKLFSNPENRIQQWR